MGRVRDVQLFTLFRNFLTIYLPVQRKVSENTVVDYRISLNQLIEYIGSMSILWAQKVELFSQHNICRENYFLGC